MPEPTASPIPNVRPTRITSLQELDELLGYLRVQNNMRISINASADAEIAQITSRRIKETATIDAEIEAGTSLAMAWLQANRPEVLGKAKSRKLAHGTVGFRRTAEKVVFDLDEVAIVRNLRALKLDNCIQQTATVRKDEVRTLEEATLLQIGVHLEAGEVAYIEIAKDKAAPYGKAS